MYAKRPDEKKDSAPEQLPRPYIISLILSVLWFILPLAFFGWLWYQGDAYGNPVPQIDYSAFRQQVRQGNVYEVKIDGQEIQGELHSPVALERDSDDESETYTIFSTYIPAIGDDSLLPLLEEHGVTIATVPSSDISLWVILLNFLPILLLIGFFYYFYNRSRQPSGGLFPMGQNQARRYEPGKESMTFRDVAGLDGAKIELQEIIDYLREPERVQQLGGSIPQGVLLVGPPGTGKTLLARAVAGEAKVPFFSITGSDFMEMYVGVGASRVRGLFNDARQAAPAIIFIDELDSIGRLRGAGLGGGHDEREQTLNQLLSELDGFEPSVNLIVMAATNRPDILDPALLRPGRFDRHVTVDLPNQTAREQILGIHARNKPLAADVDLSKLARATPGFSGADLENILNEAALLAARQRKKMIEWRDIEEARDKVLMGLVREGLTPTDEECRLIAYHEAGHALMAALLPHADPVHKVTIVPRGRAMGVTQQLPEREKLLYTRAYLLDRLAVMMGGRVAEEIIFGTITSGAENDLKQATQLARQMVLDWGMCEELGHVALGGRRQQVFLGEEIGHARDYSEATAREVDEAIRNILDKSYARATTTLTAHRQQLETVADMLLAKEELTGEEVDLLLEESLSELPRLHEEFVT